MGLAFIKLFVTKSTMVSEGVQTDISISSSPYILKSGQLRTPVLKYIQLSDPRSATKEILRTPLFVKDRYEGNERIEKSKVPYLETDIDAVENRNLDIEDDLFEYEDFPCPTTGSFTEDSIKLVSDTEVVSLSSKSSSELSATDLSKSTEVFVDDIIFPQIEISEPIEKPCTESIVHSNKDNKAGIMKEDPCPLINSQLTPSFKRERRPLSCVHENQLYQTEGFKQQAKWSVSSVSVACTPPHRVPPPYSSYSAPAKKTSRPYKALWDQENSLFI